MLTNVAISLLHLQQALALHLHKVINRVVMGAMYVFFVFSGAVSGVFVIIFSVVSYDVLSAFSSGAVCYFIIFNVIYALLPEIDAVIIITKNVEPKSGHVNHIHPAYMGK